MGPGGVFGMWWVSCRAGASMRGPPYNPKIDFLLPLWRSRVATEAWTAMNLLFSGFLGFLLHLCPGASLTVKLGSQSRACAVELEESILVERERGTLAFFV